MTETKKEILEPIPNIDLSQPDDILAQHTLNWEYNERQRIAEAVNTADEYLRVKVTEEQFEDAFLPLFTGEPNKYSGVDLYVYSNYAGGPNRELSIVNSKTQEEVLRVPPIFSNDKINLNTPRDPQNSYYELMGRINQIDSRLPIRGAKLLLLLGAKKWESIKNKEQYFDLFKRWNKVFAHYGKEVIRIPGFTDTELGIPEGYVATKVYKDPKSTAASKDSVSNTGSTNPTASSLEGWDEDEE